MSGRCVDAGLLDLAEAVGVVRPEDPQGLPDWYLGGLCSIVYGLLFASIVDSWWFG